MRYRTLGRDLAVSALGLGRLPRVDTGRIGSMRRHGRPAQ